MSDRNTRIRATQFRNLTLLPEDIKATNVLGSAMDGYIPSYDLATGEFTWIESSGGVSGSASYSVSFTNANLVSGILTVTHNLNVSHPVVVIYDNNSNEISPDEIIYVSVNSIQVDLSSFGTLSGTWYVRVIGGAISQIVIRDEDGDTKIQVEESADEDIIRFDIAGTEIANLQSDGIHGNLFKNTGLQNLLLNGDFEYWYSGTTSAPDGWTLNGTGATIVRESTEKKLGSYSAKITYGSDPAYIFQLIHSTRGIDYWKGRTITLSCWIKTSTASQARLFISDSILVTYSDYHSGSGNWELLTVTKTIDSSATFIRIACILNSSGSGYFDGVMVVEGNCPFIYSEHPEDHLYRQNIIGINPYDVVTSSDNSNFNGLTKNMNYAYPTNINQYLNFSLRIPVDLYGKSIVIDSFTVYYNTQANGDYIDLVRINYVGDDGIVVTILTHNDDIANGTNGDGNHDIIDTPLTINVDRPLNFYLVIAGTDTNTDVRFYSAVIKYHIKVHG